MEGKRTGVGRYLINLLQQWSEFDIGNRISNIKFILYFKDEIPRDLPQSELFEFKLLNVLSTAKFIHWDLCRAAKKDKIDILFCPDYIGPLFYKGKIAVTLHDISYEAHPEWFNWPSPADRILLKWVSKKTAQKAEIIFVPLEFSKSEVIKYYGVAPEKIIVTGEGVDPVLIYKISEKSGEDIAKIKEKYGIKDKLAFYFGSIFLRRHLKEAIGAFEKIAFKKRDYQLLIGGKDYTNGKSVDKLVKKVNKNLNREAILRVDFIPDNDLKLLCSAAAFFIWISDYEGFGLPPLEAISNSAPVITTNGTSLKEVAGEAAILIENNKDVQEIYQAMKNITEDDNLRSRLIEKGKEQVKKFSWERCAEITLDALSRA
ncbi:MAG: glycosyltransferase family 4 protein [Candidatus Portnoybacteria bacterium]|nr:glycosyltransferase family 4 protein [Candidatus Portnoybacteria bacterium]